MALPTIVGYIVFSFAPLVQWFVVDKAGRPLTPSALAVGNMAKVLVVDTANGH